MNFLKSNWISLGAVVLAIIALSVGLNIKPISESTGKLGTQVQNDLFYFTGTPWAIDATGITYTQGGLVEGGVSTITPTVGTATTTLSLSSLLNGTTVILNSASSTAENLVVPGTSTLSVASGFLPNVGDVERDFIDIASTTGPGAVLSAGAGLTLKFATSTNTVAAGGNIVSITFIRDTLNSLLAIVGVSK